MNLLLDKILMRFKSESYVIHDLINDGHLVCLNMAAVKEKKKSVACGDMYTHAMAVVHQVAGAIASQPFPHVTSPDEACCSPIVVVSFVW